MPKRPKTVWVAFCGGIAGAACGAFNTLGYWGLGGTYPYAIAGSLVGGFLAGAVVCALGARVVWDSVVGTK